MSQEATVDAFSNFKFLTNLKILWLCSNCLSQELVDQLSILPKFSHLEVDHEDEDCFQRLTCLTRLEQLTVFQVTNPNPWGLTNLVNLTRLSLSSKPELGTISLDYLAPMTRLTDLHCKIPKNRISISTNLCSLSNLKKLSLRNCVQGDEILEYSNFMTGLNELSIHGPRGLGEVGIKALSMYMTQIECLNLQTPEPVKDLDYTPFFLLTRLQSLTLHGNRELERSFWTKKLEFYKKGQGNHEEPQ